MRTAISIVIMMIMMTTSGCRQTDLSEPSLTPDHVIKTKKSNSKKKKINLVTNNLQDDYLEDAIDLAEARCSNDGGSWNGEDCVHCPEYKIWDRDRQSCLVY